MKILGISAFYHDSAAAILADGVIIAAAQEERFTRKKHDSSFPANAVKYCLEEAGFEIEELDAIVFYDKPYLKFERLMETYYGFAPRGVRSFFLSIPVWIKEKIFLKKMLRDEIKKIGKYEYGKTKFLFPEHHLSHSASAFYPSPFSEAAILTIDGVGEWATASISHGKGKEIKLLKELKFPHSLGLLYSAFTYYLGFKVNSGEYKLMGLAPYGNRGEDHKKYLRVIQQELTDLKEDGSVWLNQKYFNYSTGLRMAKDSKWEQLFGFKRKNPEEEFRQQHCDLALAIQDFTEDAVLKMATEAKRLTGSENLCMAGGVALNCVANGKLFRSNIFKNIFIQPAAGDAGGALGAAFAAHHIYYSNERNISGESDSMNGAYLGPSFSNEEIQKAIRKFKAPFEKFESADELYKKTAELLDEGKVVGWFQGRMEFGPRALGNRSILGDPRNPEMQKKLNLKIKFRESFRPFAPAVLSEKVSEYFDHQGTSPYMLIVADVLEKHRKPLPPGYEKFNLREKLYHLRSSVPAITHIDFSARIQTVHKETNPRFHRLIESFFEKTGCPILVNTSFNVRGEPIVCNPTEAYTCLMRTEMDALVMGDLLFLKENQPDFKDKADWKTEFTLD